MLLSLLQLRVAREEHCYGAEYPKATCLASSTSALLGIFVTSSGSFKTGERRNRKLPSAPPGHLLFELTYLERGPCYRKGKWCPGCIKEIPAVGGAGP